MAGTRKFDYVAISESYKNMNEIIGDTTNLDSIAGILHNIDLTYREYVDVSDKAVYGDLGSQLLLDWDNTSSDFPSFVTNFENWATLVANAAGAYQKFEEDIANTKIENPLGTASQGRGQAYTLDGNYSSFNSEALNTAALSVHSYVPLSGIGYIDTDMVNYERSRKTGAIWSFGLNVLSTGLGIWGGAGVVRAEVAAGKTLASSYNYIQQNGVKSLFARPSAAANASAATNGVSNQALQEADDAVAAASQNLNNLMNPESGATQGMIDLAKNELDDALTLQANLRAQQASSGLANSALQEADDAVAAASQNLNNLMNPESGATQGMIDLAKNELDDALALRASLSNQASTSGVAGTANAAQSGGILGSAEAPDLSWRNLAANARQAAGTIRDGVVTATRTGGVNPKIYTAFAASELAEGIVPDQQKANEQSITSVPVNGVLGSNASVSDSVYGNR